MDLLLVSLSTVFLAVANCLNTYRINRLAKELTLHKIECANLATKLAQIWSKP